MVDVVGDLRLEAPSGSFDSAARCTTASKPQVVERDVARDRARWSRVDRGIAEHTVGEITESRPTTSWPAAAERHHDGAEIPLVAGDEDLHDGSPSMDRDAVGAVPKVRCAFSTTKASACGAGT